MVNEDVGWTTADRNQILADPALSQYVSIVADHGYGQAFNPYQLFSNNMGKQVWMTIVEYIPGQVSTWTPRFRMPSLPLQTFSNAISVASAKRISGLLFELRYARPDEQLDDAQHEPLGNGQLQQVRPTGLGSRRRDR